MRRSTKFQGVEEEAELLLCALVAEAKGLEHAHLCCSGMNTDGAAAHLVAIEHHIVGPGLGTGRISCHELHVAFHGSGKGMVAGNVAVLFLVVFEERELSDPEEVEAVLGDEIELLGNVHAQIAEGCVHHFRIACLEEEDVPGLCIKAGTNGRALLLGQEFGYGRLPLGVGLDLDPGKALGAVDAHKVRKGVNFLAGQAFSAVYLDGLDHGGLGEELEAGIAHSIRQLHKLHAKAGVGLVHAVVAHGLVPGHAREGKLKILADHVLEDALHEPFGHAHDVVLAHKAQLHVHLGELGLTVCTQVLVAEAAHDLEVLLETGAHEQLLEQLGRLGQGVEGALVQTARHKEVACAFGSGLCEEGGLNLEEALLVQEVADGLHGLVALNEILLHAGPAQIEETPGKTQVFASIASVLNGKGRCLGGVQELPLVHHHFNGTSLEVGIGHALGALAHPALDGNDVLKAQYGCLLVSLGCHVRREDNLGQTFAIAQINKYETSVIPAELNPAHEADLAAHIFGRKVAAAACSGPVAKIGDVFGVFQLEILNLFTHNIFP